MGVLQMIVPPLLFAMYTLASHLAYLMTDPVDKIYSAHF